MSVSIAEIVHAEIAPGCWLAAERALYLAEEKTLVVADIHWGYAYSHRQAGNLLPLWGNEEIARRLRCLLRRYRPARMIWLGDSLHTPASAEFAEGFLAERPDVECVVIEGNHDRGWPRAAHAEYGLGPYLFHHGHRERQMTAEQIEVIGHLHPAITWSDGAGMRLRVPALIQGPRRLVLPSFSDWSAGASWNGRASADETLWMISPRKVWPLPREPRN